MRTVRFPLLRGSLFLIALAAIAFIMARGDNPAQATSYNPSFAVSVSDPNPGANADLVINFSLDAPDAFPNVRTHSSIQFLPRAWGINADAPIGGHAGTFNALTTIGILGEICYFPTPVPFTMIDATTDTSNRTSALDLGGDYHPTGLGYSGQFVDDPDTIQTPGDVGLPLVPFNADEKATSFAGFPFSAIYSSAYRDVDNNGHVSPGDIRLALGVYEEEFALGSVVQPGDSDTRQQTALRAFSGGEMHAENVAANGVMDPGEWIYRDQDGNATVSYGDLRLYEFGFTRKNSVVTDFALTGGVSRYPDFLAQMFPPEVIGEPLARQWGGRDVVNVPVSLNILTFRPGQLPGYPAQMGYPNVVVLLNPVAPIDRFMINLTNDLCTPLSLTSTNFGLSQDNPATLDNEEGFVRLTNPKAEKSHDFTLVTTSQPDADNDGIENMLDSCQQDPNAEDFDGRWTEALRTGNYPADFDFLDKACDPDPVTRFQYDEDMDGYVDLADNCSTVANGVEILNHSYVSLRDVTFVISTLGDLIGPSNQADTDGDDIGDACEGAETAAECLNDLDDDADGAINDGCPMKYAEGGDQCLNDLDDDGDGKINDGCPKVGGGESGFRCNNNLDDDPSWAGGPDGYVNDGCPRFWSPGAEETVCDNNLDDDGDGLVNDGCLSVDAAGERFVITGHMHTVTLTQGVPIAKHGVKLDDLDGKEKVAAGGSASYTVSVENKADSAEDAVVALRVVEGCGTVSGPSTVHVNGDATANAQYTVDFSGCAAGEYTVQADACHAGDPAPAGLFGEGACPGASDGLADTNQLDDAPRSLTVVVGSP